MKMKDYEVQAGLVLHDEEIGLRCVVTKVWDKIGTPIDLLYSDGEVVSQYSFDNDYTLTPLKGYKSMIEGINSKEFKGETD